MTAAHEYSAKFNDNCIVALHFRLNFTLEDLDVACPAYEQFLSCVEKLTSSVTPSGAQFTAERVTDFRQYFTYERTKYLVCIQSACSREVFEQYIALWLQVKFYHSFSFNFSWVLIFSLV